jgi:hypothetical protein
LSLLQKFIQLFIKGHLLLQIHVHLCMLLVSLPLYVILSLIWISIIHSELLHLLLLFQESFLHVPVVSLKFTTLYTQSILLRFKTLVIGICFLWSCPQGISFHSNVLQILTLLLYGINILCSYPEFCQYLTIIIILILQFYFELLLLLQSSLKILNRYILLLYNLFILDL